MEIRTEVLVVGGGVGGVAAALGALGAGRAVVLTEESPWLGGQLTTQAVPPDEHPWIEQRGSTGRYRALRRAIRAHYRRWYPLSEAAKHSRYLNPGGSWVSPLSHEPRVARAVIADQLQPSRSSGRLTLLMDTRPVASDLEGDLVRAVRFHDARHGRSIDVVASVVIDATETGQLLELTHTEFITGSESRGQTGEPHASEERRPLNMQAFTVCLAVDHVAGADFVIERPASYAMWRSAVQPHTAAPYLSWTATNPRTLEPISYPFEPEASDMADDRSHVQGKAPGAKDLWTYRRIIARRNFAPGAYLGDISVINWPQNDFAGGALIGVSAEAAAEHLAQARELTLSLLYWLQTDAPRPDGGVGWPGLRPRGDVVGTTDGLALRPYVRESRRIAAEYTVTELDVSAALRRTAAQYPDSVGTGYYRIDLHPTTGGDNFVDIASVPYELPLGALLPVRVDNLLPGAKNIGTTHVTNGCYRVHPTEWLVGEVAGMLAGYAIEHRIAPRAVRSSPAHREAFQSELVTAGVDLHWPKGLRAPS